MLSLLSRKVSLAWLLMALILSAAGLLLAKVAVLDAPPRNAVLISAAPSVVSGSPRTPGAVLQTAATALPGPLHTAASPTASSSSSPDATDSGNTLRETPDASPTQESVLVYVTGAVQKPGVYALTAGSRISDVVVLAGGLLPEADTARVNLAERVVDEEHILVPKMGETPAPVAVLPTRSPGSASPTRPASAATRPPAQPTQPKPDTLPGSKVNINTATAAQLESLPGIGPSLSQKIVDFRDAHGPFAAPEDIMLVPGIKEGVFAKIRDYISVGP